MQQAKILAQELESVWFKDSINKLLAQENANLNFTIDKQRAMVSSLGYQVANLRQINHNHVGHIVQLQQDKSRIIKKSRLHKFLLGTGLGIMSVLAAIH